MNIDTVLEKWNEAKKQKNIAEKKCNEYKDAVERFMNRKNLKVLDGQYFAVNRRSNTRLQLSKKNIPSDLFNRYANRVTYTSYHLKEKNNFN